MTHKVLAFIWFLSIRISDNKKCLKSKILSIQISDISGFWKSGFQTLTVFPFQCKQDFFLPNVLKLFNNSIGNSIYYAVKDTEALDDSYLLSSSM